PLSLNRCQFLLGRFAPAFTSWRLNIGRDVDTPAHFAPPWYSGHRPLKRVYCWLMSLPPFENPMCARYYAGIYSSMKTQCPPTPHVSTVDLQGRCTYTFRTF
ncbi:unnamed protein product, partial [Sphacelaria rigidula]